MTQATATAPRPATTVDHPNRPPGAWSTSETVQATGVTERQLRHAVDRGLIRPSVDHTPGSGSRWWWSAADVDLLRQVRARLDWGMSMRGALRTDTPPPLVP